MAALPDRELHRFQVDLESGQVPALCWSPGCTGRLRPLNSGRFSSPIIPWSTLSALRFYSIYVDLVGNKRPAGGQTYLPTFLDLLTVDETN